jgi:nicotinate-nucleotide pyrophosphorylase (carboxylating)
LDSCFIEVEVESLKQAIAAAKVNREEKVPDMILLDNMKPRDVIRCVEAIKKEAGGDILIEASGGITSKNISAYLEAGVDVVSMSALTLSAKPLDMNLKIVGYK